MAEEVAAADGAVREAKIKQRDIDRELARLESERRANPPRKIDLRIGVVAGETAPATLRVTYTVRNARWVPLYDARLDTGGKGGKPSLELIRRAEVVQSTGEDWTMSRSPSRRRARPRAAMRRNCGRCWRTSRRHRHRPRPLTKSVTCWNQGAGQSAA